MEHTFELIRQSQAGDKEAKEQLIMLHSGLIWNVVRRFMGRGYETEDLYQIGAIGLIRAIDKFDFNYDVKFSTYAVPLISGEIKRFLRDDGMIKVSRTLKENQWRIKRTMEMIQNEKGREATVEEIAKELEMEAEEIMLCMEAVVEVESMDQSIYAKDGKEISLKDRLADEKNEQEDLMNHLFLEQLLESLGERDRTLITLRYYENKTQNQVAEILGISQVQVSRLEKKILRRMKELA
ncbi:MAG: SigB/SigF/SigG family RNA polymerase sigma factor [Lachnospiraceae bacterium]|nr:SigB/SigF/SigG family RNA polymerase sigma factor [Lachnospiraceae bacterium]